MDQGVKLPYIRVRTSEKDLATPSSNPDVGTIGRHTSPRKLRPLTKDMRKEDPICNTVYITAVQFLFAGYMRGDLRAPNASGSISIGRHRTELQPLQKWVLESGYKLTGRIYLSLASSVWKDAQCHKR